MRVLENPDQAVSWLHSLVQGRLVVDSRQVSAGDGFVAWPGAATDGRRYVASALERGASACLMELEGLDGLDLGVVPGDAHAEALAAYPGLKAACGPIAARYFGEPASALRICAVTGTNGKTSTAWWLAQALSRLAAPYTQPCGIVGTLGVGRVPEANPSGSEPVKTLIHTGLTTPDPVLLHSTLRRFVNEGLLACAMEASSIGLQEHRLDGTAIHTAIFTNFTQDHLDYHGSMEAYWQAKARLFGWAGLKAAVLNIDDIHGARLADQLADAALDVWTVSCESSARLQARDIRIGTSGLSFTVCEAGSEVPLDTSLVGRYNVANLLGVIAAMRSLGVPLTECVEACRRLSPVPGRMQCLGEPGEPLAVVDYAHTPDALTQVLQALRPLAQARGGRLWCLFGCGGDRDASKRPLMGAAATQHADQVVVTSDNPRFEDPQTIMAQILRGMASAPALAVVDRAQAIAQTVSQAHADDVILVAGKGHEDYQEIAGQRQPFQDARQVLLALQARRHRRAHEAGQGVNA